MSIAVETIYIEFMGLKFRDIFRLMIEVLLRNRVLLNVNDCHVIDVSTSNGNFLIYLVIRDPEKIYTVEPSSKDLCRDPHEHQIK